jgi:SAM-dependent methyltransferase
MIRDFLLFPLRCLFPNNEYIGFLGVTPLSDERFQAVRPYLKGRVLDVGCGDNRLIREYRSMGGDGVGADLPVNQDADVAVSPGLPLPFETGYFDTVVMLAALNHIPDREKILCECSRCLVPGGTIALTTLGPLVGGLGHWLWKILASDADLGHRQEADGELSGLSGRSVRKLLRSVGFCRISSHSFSMGLNHLYVGMKPEKD